MKTDNIIDFDDYRVLKEPDDLNEKFAISDELKSAIEHLICRLRNPPPLAGA